MKKFLNYVCYSLITVGALYFAINGVLFLYPNFHTVLPNEIYLSRQLNTAQFEHYIRKYHIKSILNLRGKSTQPWYQDEMRAVAATHIKHYDIGLPAKGLVSVENMRTLIHIIQNAPKPLLIHCWHGADRAGLGSAIALVLFTKQPLKKVKQQVSWKYGVVAPTSAGRVEISAYQRWLKQHHLISSAENFLSWLQSLQSHKNYPNET